jgi:SAM-dependent methyltransferase
VVTDKEMIKTTPAMQRVKCAFCESGQMHLIIDFGRVALAGAFVSAEQFAEEQRFPMRLYFCESCYAVQLVDVVDAKILFKNNSYFYFSSAIPTLVEHFRDYATEVTARFLEPASATVIEIGCNDGILLKPLADQGIRRVVGVDPATNIVQTINDSRINIVNDFFSESTADKIAESYGKADLIVANNVYAHISDIRGLTQGIDNILKDDGVFVFEVHYLEKVLRGLQYDMIYHEHLYYYSLIALINHFERFGMVIFDVKAIPIHAGSMRYYVCKKGSKYAQNISQRVNLLKQSELKMGLDRRETFTNFAANIALRKERLMDLLERIRAKGKTIAGYGASGRANTIIQYCGINHNHLEYMIDDAPAKAGFYTPGSHFLIHPSSVLKSESRPDYLLVLAWSYFNEIAERCGDFLAGGGRLIQPLPEVRITFQPNDLDEL